MAVKDISLAREIGGNDIVMQKYIDEAEVASREEILIESYDKEWALRDEGKREGYELGTTEGEQKERIKNAKAMLEENIDIGIISKVTGLSIEEIEKLND